jgi:hypothetical protein
MKKLQVIETKIIRSIYDRNRYAPNTSMHITLGVTTLNEEIKRACAKLNQRFRQLDNPIIAAGNCNIHMHYFYTRPRQVLH